MIRALQPGQHCEVWIASVTGEHELVFTTRDLLLEAPNWTLDGAACHPQRRRGSCGRSISPGRSLSQVPLTGIPGLNNDHVLDPDGEHIFLSANDGHIYHAALRGGRATRITKDDGSFHFLHGVSPDGQELAYVGIEAGDFTRPGRLMTIPAGGGASTPISVNGHCDGPEYSPDGEWLYFNTEAFTSQPGHAQLARCVPPPAAPPTAPITTTPSGSLRATPSTGSRICPRTAAWPATSVSPAARKGTLRTCPSTSCLSPRTTGQRRCTHGRSSAGRGR